MRRAGPEFSIVVPVLYEEDTVSGQLEHIYSLDGADRCEVIVVDGDPAGGTIGTIEDDRVVTMTSPRWRSRQMNTVCGSPRSTGCVDAHAMRRMLCCSIRGVAFELTAMMRCRASPS